MDDAFISPFGAILLRDKRCVSMPSVTPVACSDHHPISRPRSRLSRVHARRFRQRFPSVDSDERLINYYSCALLSDILLQGHLYITDNHFAFYSNIFGHKTQVLIPLGDVVKLSKERTAKIIPNAVGVSTEQEKYIFGSLLTRDATYRLMHQVWMKSTDPGLGLPDDTESDNSPVLQNGTEDEVDSISGISDRSSSDISIPSKVPELPSLGPAFQASSSCSSQKVDDCAPYVAQGHMGTAKDCFAKIEAAVTILYRLPRSSVLLVMSTVLLVVLFLSASVLMYRISIIHKRMAGADVWQQDAVRRINAMFPQKQTEQTVSEVSQLIKGIEDRIRQLAHVREALEELLVTATHLRSICKPQTSPPTDSNSHWVSFASP